jgi:hypothetical protein
VGGYRRTFNDAELCDFGKKRHQFVEHCDVEECFAVKFEAGEDVTRRDEGVHGKEGFACHKDLKPTPRHEGVEEQAWDHGYPGVVLSLVTLGCEVLVRLSPTMYQNADAT